jgi:hypothetical protein
VRNVKWALVDSKIRGVRVKRFIVNSDVQAPGTDVSLVRTIPVMLRSAKIENVKLKTAYCCTPDRKIIAEFEGPDKETVSSALSKINMPFTVIMEATKVE